MTHGQNTVMKTDLKEWKKIVFERLNINFIHHCIVTIYWTGSNVSLFSVSTLNRRFEYENGNVFQQKRKKFSWMNWFKFSLFLEIWNIANNINRNFEILIFVSFDKKDQSFIKTTLKVSNDYLNLGSSKNFT